jgi:hypothetical protein
LGPAGDGCDVEVHQLVDSPDHADFMEAAWTLVLGRLKAGVVSASGGLTTTPSRPRRPKQRQAG